MQRMLIVVVSLAAGVTFAVASGSADEDKPTDRAPKRVNYFELGREVEVVGRTGQPLGKLLQIEGALFQPKPDEGIPKSYEWTTVFVVDRINGRALSEPVRVSLANPGSRKSFELKTKRRMRLTGYEDGGFVEEPPEVWEWRRKRGEPIRPGYQRYFKVDFLVLEAEPIAAAKAPQKQQALPVQK